MNRERFCSTKLIFFFSLSSGEKLVNLLFFAREHVQIEIYICNRGDWNQTIEQWYMDVRDSVVDAIQSICHFGFAEMNDNNCERTALTAD